jgi:predicted methyltransferase
LTSHSTDADVAGTIRAALASPDRRDEHRARDAQRHPLETLSFFGLRDDSAVLELWPAGGYFAEIVAPVVAARGRLVLARIDPTTPDAPPSPVDTRVRSSRGLSKVGLHSIDPRQVDLGPEGSYDLVFNSRNYHAWIRRGLEQAIATAVFRVLEPGGVFGIEEHRGLPGADEATILKTGYVPEDRIIGTLERAGFRLAGKSEVNANPRDSKDHPNGVWSLPPSLRGEVRDREKFVAIGESDRATLKFVKP